MIGRYTAVTAAAAALCLCIAVVQVLDLANTRVALEDVPGVQEPQPQYIHLTDNNGFGTNAAFIGMADGQGSSVRAARAQQLAGFSLSNENLAKIQFSQKNGYRPDGVVQLPDAGDMGTNSAYLGQDRTVSSKAAHLSALRLKRAQGNSSPSREVAADITAFLFGRKRPHTAGF